MNISYQTGLLWLYHSEPSQYLQLNVNVCWLKPKTNLLEHFLSEYKI